MGPELEYSQRALERAIANTQKQIDELSGKTEERLLIVTN
jgi:hypothetical protein